MCFFRNCQNEFKELFSQENDLVFFNDVCSVIEALGHQNDPTEWRLFIDSSNVVIKAVLLHNGNKFPSVPPAHVGNMQESYENMKLFMKRSSMKNIIGTFVGILMVIALLLGLWLGYTKFCCFLCDCDRRDKKKTLHPKKVA